MRLIFLTLILLATLPLSLAHSATLHVSKSGNGTDGSSWESAFVEIGDAIEAATSGVQIWIASGTYNESLNIELSNLSLFGGFHGNETQNAFLLRDLKANETIVDATGLHSRCLLISDANNILLDGITFRNARLEGQLGKLGGGFAIVRSQVAVSNCKIQNNLVGTSPDGVRNSGGGMYIADADVKVINCHFVDNYAAGSGGAILTLDPNPPFNDTNLHLTNCLFDGNVGTAVYTDDTQVHLEYCTFGRGYKWATHNDLFHLDTFPSSGPEGATVTNCIIRDNLRPFMNVTYSNIRDYPGEGNIDEDAGWIDREGGDFHLRSNSPCIDAGTDVEVLNDLDGNPRPIDVKGRGIGQGFDMGCYEFQLKRSDLDENGYINGEDLLIFQAEWMREGLGANSQE